MPLEDNEELLAAVVADLAALRTLVLVLTDRLITVNPNFKSDMAGGFSAAAQDVLSDEFLAKQGSLALRLNSALEDLRDRIQQLRPT